NATVPVGVPTAVPFAYCVPPDPPPVMLTFSDPPVFVRGVPLDWMLDVTVPDTTHGLVLWVTATGFVMVVRVASVPMLVTVLMFQVPLCVAATVPVTVTAFV